jgi:hypothetical protein
MSNEKNKKCESWDGVVLLESSSIKWKLNDGHSLMCKHCKGTNKNGPKPLTVCRAFASTEWENHILSARHRF